MCTHAVVVGHYCTSTCMCTVHIYVHTYVRMCTHVVVVGCYTHVLSYMCTVCMYVCAHMQWLLAVRTRELSVCSGNVTQLHGVGRSRASDGSVDPLSSPGVALITGECVLETQQDVQGAYHIQ